MTRFVLGFFFSRDDFQANPPNIGRTNSVTFIELDKIRNFQHSVGGCLTH